MTDTALIELVAFLGQIQTVSEFKEKLIDIGQSYDRETNNFSYRLVMKIEELRSETGKGLYVEYDFAGEKNTAVVYDWDDVNLWVLPKNFNRRILIFYEDITRFWLET